MVIYTCVYTCKAIKAIFKKPKWEQTYSACSMHIIYMYLEHCKGQHWFMVVILINAHHTWSYMHVYLSHEMHNQLLKLIICTDTCIHSYFTLPLYVYIVLHVGISMLIIVYVQYMYICICMKSHIYSHPTCSLSKVIEFLSSLCHLLNVWHHYTLHLLEATQDVFLILNSYTCKVYIQYK